MLMALTRKCYRPSIIEAVASFTEQISALLLSVFAFITLFIFKKAGCLGYGRAVLSLLSIAQHQTL